ncbi:MAG: hypothetical protein N3D84_03260, partial [Candidatus Woesearchaeota archaeon]|nr:hypothetical protein [Candidatus Woesearchaeota archaeon]
MNIKENLLKMKNMTEHMLDLAYSAVFLEDREILDEVKQMHFEMSILEENTLKMLFKVKESEADRLFLLDLIGSMKEISNAALHIGVLAEKKAPSIVNEILKESHNKVISAKISSQSPYSNKTIGESKIWQETNVKILGVKRGKKWIFDI